MDAEWDMYEKVRSTWPRLDRWRERIRSDFRPAAGSELADDDLDWPPMPVSQVAWAGLGSATMHLHGMRLHLDPWPGRKPELVPFAQLSLGRGALIGATQAVWVLAPAERKRRLERSRIVSRYVMDEQRKFLKDVAPLPGTHDRALEVVQRHVTERLKELDRLRTASDERAALNTTQMVKDAAAAAFSDPDLVGEAVAMWRLGSAAAHGLIWSVFGGSEARTPSDEELATPSPPAEEAVLAEMSAGGDMVRNGNLYLAAFHMAGHAWRLIGERGGVNTGPCVS